MPSTSERRHASDMLAYRHLGNYEVRRNRSNGNFAILLRGTQTQCGTIYQRAAPLVRAMMVATDASKYPAADRARTMQEGSRGIDPTTGKRRYNRNLVHVSGQPADHPTTVAVRQRQAERSGTPRSGGGE